MGKIQQNLDELIKEYDNEDEAFEGEMDYSGSPKNKYLRIKNKNFYFDIKTNKQGCYMSIAEVKGNHRNSIVIPKSGWDKFHEMKRFKVDDTSFNFDINKSHQGRYRVNGKFRNSILVPESVWKNFRDKMDKCIKQSVSFPIEEVEEVENETKSMDTETSKNQVMENEPIDVEIENSDKKESLNKV